MDQDAFRKLLSETRPKTNAQPSSSRGSLLKPAKAPEKKATGAKAEFKPRNIKKSAGDYRDRAAERRTGKAGDFAEAEAVLETFEKQHADEDRDTVEERRRYLGGDAAHTVLVKGLDFALLEQQRAKVSATDAAQDDEALEAVYNDAGGFPTQPTDNKAISGKKRTREELLKELKTKRAKGEVTNASPPVEDKAIEEAKKAGKFKPIGSGFKPIGKTKDVKASEGTVKKKKKRKIENTTIVTGKEKQDFVPTQEGIAAELPEQSEKAKEKKAEPEPEPEPLPEDFDIFAGAGEYDGLNIGDDDDSDEGASDGEIKQGSPRTISMDVDKEDRSGASAPPRRNKWFSDDEESEPGEIASPGPKGNAGKGKGKAAPSNSRSPSQEPSAPPQRSPTPEPARLAPLASSALPSIRDMLAADEALEVEEKRKARREKRKAGGGGGVAGGEKKSVSKEAKLNRDYQKLKSYQEKKG